MGAKERSDVHVDSRKAALDAEMFAFLNDPRFNDRPRARLGACILRAQTALELFIDLPDADGKLRAEVAIQRVGSEIQRLVDVRATGVPLDEIPLCGFLSGRGLRVGGSS